MKQSSSNRKVNEQAREVIASILLFEISDPRLELVTVTGCEVSYDRSVCNVFYTTEPERFASALQRDARRSAVAAPTDSDVPADADAFAAQRADEQEAARDGEDA